MVPHTDKTGLCSYEEWAHAASWISLMYSLICTDSNQLSWISLKWFVWFMSHDNFLGCCLDPRAQLIINPGCSGQICHSVTSSASKRHTGVTDHHALSESCPQDVPVGNFRRPWQTNIGGVIQQPLFYEPGPPLLPLPPHVYPLPLAPMLFSPPHLLCGLHTDPSPSSHTLLCWSPLQPTHDNQPTFSCMSTAFVCGGKHVRNVLWLRRPWKDRCSLCGEAYGEMVFAIKKRYSNTTAGYEWRDAMIATFT